MFDALMELALGLPNAHYAPRARIEHAMSAIVEVSQERDFEPLPLGGSREENTHGTARLIATWSFFESGWNVGALGDGGQSCGVMQTNRMWTPCARARSSAKEGYRAGLRVLAYYLNRCGTLARALGGYATGECTTGVQLVKRRCALARIKCG